MDPSQSVAVLIGVANSTASDFPPVPAATENLIRLGRALTGKAWGLRRPMRLIELVDPDRSTVLRTVADAGKLLGRQGLLLLYFVGHAEPIGDELCLALTDADRSNPRDTMLTVTALVEATGTRSSHRHLLVLDCCFSGRAAARLPGVSARLGDTAGWYFMGAADGGSAASAPRDGETTLFTAALLRAMEGHVGHGESLSPTDVLRIATDLLPDDHLPVHNDLAWGQRLQWLRNLRYTPPARRPVHLRETASGTPAPNDWIPAPPALYAEPPYIGSHEFVGRSAQLDELTRWAAQDNDTEPVMLLEAIGGSGKSMLTWHWTAGQAKHVRDDWAGFFWYSFYERSSTMADFCRHALAYVNEDKPEHYAELNQAELTRLVLLCLRARPWLMVLDGLERVLVAYNRFDSAQLADEEAGRQDAIASRDPCAAIRPADDELLRRLAAAQPSRILVTSRLVPRVLLNTSGQPIPGVRRHLLPGLTAGDAEALLRACGVHGSSHQMTDYLRRHCAFHPLVTGVVGGLVNNYMPARGTFDDWAADPGHGGSLDVGDLDLVQKRNHILRSAVDALSSGSRKLLWTMSLIPGAVDYPTLRAFNPFATVATVQPQSQPPRDFTRDYAVLPPGSKRREKAQRDYQRVLDAWLASQPQGPEDPAADEPLDAALYDLERRGLVQFDRRVARWDLHPIVRAIGSTAVGGAARETIGMQIVDHFSKLPSGPDLLAETLEDIFNALVVVQTLIHIGRTRDAWLRLEQGLLEVLVFNAEAYAETLAVLKPLVPENELSWPKSFAFYDKVLLRTYLAMLYNIIGDGARARAIHCAVLHECVELRQDVTSTITLVNISVTHSSGLQLAAADLATAQGLEAAELTGNAGARFVLRLERFVQLATVGRWAEAEQLWEALDGMGRDWPRRLYRPGGAELEHLLYGAVPLEEQPIEALEAAERLLRSGANRGGLRRYLAAKGNWHLARSEPAQAADSFHEAVRMSNECGIRFHRAEVCLALAKARAHATMTKDEAERLSTAPEAAASAIWLARLWRELGDERTAATHAMTAYRAAWADGEPFVVRRALDAAAALLRELGSEIPNLPAYDASQRERQPWEGSAEQLLNRLRRTRQPA
ncbi:hypothetical protein ACFPIJ_33635 [Dactylosporangium cerinum]|uniref:Uncharacterized protein n=1 Tax=Dactylosporangium cerinum TaxID=1434730 RepID=A0ABV9W264_9ACTN